MNDTSGIAAFFAAVAGLGIIFVLIGLVLWVLKSIGLSQMAKNKGIENEWLAWLPVADLYIMGTIVEEINLLGIQINNLGLWFPVICLAGGLLSGIPILGIFIFIAILVFQIAFIYKLFSMYTDQAPLYTVLCVFLGFLFPIFIFSLRNNTVLQQHLESLVADTASTADHNVNGNIDPTIISTDVAEKQEKEAMIEDEPNTESADGQEEQADKDIGEKESEDSEQQP